MSKLVGFAFCAMLALSPISAFAQGYHHHHHHHYDHHHYGHHHHHYH